MMHHISEKFCLELNRAGYSKRTTNTYLKLFRRFVEAIQPKLPADLDQSEVQQAIDRLINEKELSGSYKNLVINSIKLYYQKVEKRDVSDCTFRRPGKLTSKPNVLSSNEIKQILSIQMEIRDKCMIMICYGTGMRLCDLIALRLRDIDMVNRFFLIGKDKRKKDRKVPMPESVFQVLTEYLDITNPDTYLFESTVANKPLGERSVQMMMKRKGKEAGIGCALTPQVLRNSFAAHILEMGENILYVNNLMGHKNLKTTLIYSGLTAEQKHKFPIDNVIAC